MEDVIIRQIPVGALEVFTYLVMCAHSKEAVFIDPAGEEERLAGLAATEGAKVKYLLNTHGHSDHLSANQGLKARLGARTCMHGNDVAFFARKEIQETTSRELGLPPPDPVDMNLNHGDRLEIGRLSVEVIHTPGHTPGSVCFLVKGNLFTGDTLFVGAVGRTDLTGSSLDTLLTSLEEHLLILPPQTIVWPGHDYGERPFSTIEREMGENPYITDFILG